VHTLIVSALKRLRLDAFRSTDMLAASLAATPDSVAQALQLAIAGGAPVRYQAGRGYRLEQPIDWLDAQRIASVLGDSGLDVHIVDCCDSTNLRLMQKARNEPAHGEVLAAELQTEGRGRQGRRWHAGLGAALTFSLLWRFGRPVSALQGLSLATGVAIVRALRRHGIDAGLKWPNDLLWQERKLGGILIEVNGDASGPCAAVIGIGVNVRLRDAEREQIDQAACDLSEAGGVPLSRNDWLAAMLLELSAVLAVFAEQGFAPFAPEWDRYHAHAGRQVELVRPNGERTRGIACGVDASGRLLLTTAAGTQAVMTGDVSLRAGA
jgi:BirA family biotin operon repressor/biotin-[acetyl-CoA-carboxylase] ligase